MKTKVFSKNWGPKPFYICGRKSTRKRRGRGDQPFMEPTNNQERGGGGHLTT
jgi:hypothetical protein